MNVSRTQTNAIFDTHMSDLLCNVYNNDAIYMAMLHTLALHTYGFQLKLVNKREKRAKREKEEEEKNQAKSHIFLRSQKSREILFSSIFFTN